LSLTAWALGENQSSNRKDGAGGTRRGVRKKGAAKRDKEMALGCLSEQRPKEAREEEKHKPLSCYGVTTVPRRG